jgi:hypothetical protein
MAKRHIAESSTYRSLVFPSCDGETCSKQVFVQVQGNQQFLDDLDVAVSWIEDYGRETDYVMDSLNPDFPSAEFTEAEILAISKNSSVHGEAIPSVDKLTGIYAVQCPEHRKAEVMDKFLNPIRDSLDEDEDMTEEDLLRRAYLAVLILETDFSAPLELFRSLKDKSHKKPSNNGKKRPAEETKQPEQPKKKKEENVFIGGLRDDSTE